MRINKRYFTNRFLQIILLAIALGNLSIQEANSETIAHKEDIKYDEEVSIIHLRDDCSTIEPIKKYSVRNGEIEGILYTTVCFNGYDLPNALVDETKYTFIDTGGTSFERCYGTVDMWTPSAILHKWQFLGAVPGYSCSKAKTTILRYYPKGY